MVSIHAPTWGATILHLPILASVLFQSTRPRGARRIGHITQSNRLVSIHAPTWGATCNSEAKATVSTVSIHAPTWGATTEQIRYVGYILFQSTRPRGARLNKVLLSDIRMCFNPRAHVGRDPSWMACARARSLFQSTRPRGARPTAFQVFIKTFVSIHAPTWGATGNSLDDVGVVYVSIHAPTWGATLVAS